MNRRQAVARIVEVRGLVKRHGATTAVSGASFTVEDSEIFPLPNHWGAVLVTLLPGAASFCALGVAVASLGEQADAAPAVVQFILFPLVFRSETYFPIHSTVLNNIASVLPLRPFNQALIGPFGRPAAQLRGGWLRLYHRHLLAGVEDPSNQSVLAGIETIWTTSPARCNPSMVGSFEAVCGSSSLANLAAQGADRSIPTALTHVSHLAIEASSKRTGSIRRVSATVVHALVQNEIRVRRRPDTGAEK